MRYRPGLPLVLRGVSLSVKGGEKVGIVGRTGAGKSTLVTALLRLVELDSGNITIDGTDISTLGLHALRSVVAVIPQDPVLFSGTVRTNLDPFGSHTDELLWDAVSRALLQSAISSLDDAVDENGSNFSVGQRQLLCIARAFLTKARVIVMDEATASVDVETDASIQKMIREEFSNATCLTVAHRLNTIMDSDKVLVMDQGIAAEFDSPTNLLGRQDSLFKALVDDWETSNAE
jgi:ABC-type multidrug transport system fused ATPase/permease subunit